MPETYTQEQIEKAKDYFEHFMLTKDSYWGSYTASEFYGKIIFSALSTAERERDEEREAHETIAAICFSAGSKTSDGTTICAVKDLADRLRVALARVAELEARLQGAGCRSRCWKR